MKFHHSFFCWEGLRSLKAFTQFKGSASYLSLRLAPSLSFWLSLPGKELLLFDSTGGKAPTKELNKGLAERGIESAR
jgi:hypothetical protein